MRATPVTMGLLLGAMLVVPDGAPLAAAAEAEAPPWSEAAGLWSDPAFRKAFLGTYGAPSDLEPKVSEIEQAQLKKLLPLMGKDADAAMRKLESLAKPSASAVFDFTLGNMYVQKERLADAAARYRAALQKFPNFRRALKNLGLVQVREGRFDDAVRSLSRVVELGSGDGMTYGLLGHAYAASSQPVSAESAFRAAVLLQPDLLDWKIGLAQSLLRQQKHAEVAALCGELLEKRPDRVDLYLLQAGASIGLGRPLEAAENYEIVRHSGKATPAILMTLGDIYVNEELYDPAARVYREALDRDPAQPLDKPLRWAASLAQRGAAPQARALLDRVKEIAGDTSDADTRKTILRLESRLAAAEGDDDKAAAALEQITTLDPLDGEALLLLARLHVRKGDLDKALLCTTAAESVAPYEADARLEHARILVRQSKYDEALPLLKRAQELKPREDVARYLEQVERAARK